MQEKPNNCGWLQRLLEGRINQLKGTVTITKCAHRTFAAAQWQELKQQLAACSFSDSRSQPQMLSMIMMKDHTPAHVLGVCGPIPIPPGRLVLSVKPCDKVLRPYPYASSLAFNLMNVSGHSSAQDFKQQLAAWKVSDLHPVVHLHLSPTASVLFLLSFCSFERCAAVKMRFHASKIATQRLAWFAILVCDHPA